MGRDLPLHPWPVLPLLPSSENCVKNQFYSILRRGLRKLNTIIKSRLKRYKELEISILYKIV